MWDAFPWREIVSHNTLVGSLMQAAQWVRQMRRKLQGMHISDTSKLYYIAIRRVENFVTSKGHARVCTNIILLRHAAHNTKPVWFIICQHAKQGLNGVHRSATAVCNLFCANFFSWKCSPELPRRINFIITSCAAVFVSKSYRKIRFRLQWCSLKSIISTHSGHLILFLQFEQKIMSIAIFHNL
jgi:hypothetical protein